MTENRVCKKHSITIYVKRKDGHWRCRKCACERVIQNARNKKKKLVDLAGGKCVVCGYSKCLRALQFHHLIPKEKSFGIANKYQRMGIEGLIEEVKKCILVCANCHAELEDDKVSIT